MRFFASGAGRQERVGAGVCRERPPRSRHELKTPLSVCLRRRRLLEDNSSCRKKQAHYL
ncbi:MAG: hypothetical protein ACLR4Z_06210 [Butyricicoccaceae bacterium]